MKSELYESWMMQISGLSAVYYVTFVLCDLVSLALGRRALFALNLQSKCVRKKVYLVLSLEEDVRR